jgi:DNA-binding XRE family transcriptional regulator
MLPNYPSMEDGHALIKKARTKLELSQAELARLAKTSPQQIERLENGKRELTRAWAERIGPHIGVQPFRLVFGENAELAVGLSPYDIVFLEELLTTAFETISIKGSDASVLSKGILRMAREGRGMRDPAKALNRLFVEVLTSQPPTTDDIATNG